ncbi:MAG: hemerythrin domain-containing protein [Gaiellaceae bacterium]
MEGAESGPGGCEIAGLSSAELCEHIVSTHHARLRGELPPLSTLLDKVVKAHGKDDARLVFVRSAFADLRAELEQHIDEEERVLFPAIAAGDTVTASSFEDDHERAGALLERLSELTDGYDLRSALCNTHRATLDALAELQLDLHQHIHEENNVLFPRAAAV